MHLDAQTVRVPLLHVQHAFASAHARVAARGQRRVADARRAVANDAPVVRVALAFETSPVVRRPTHSLEDVAGRIDERTAHVPVAEQGRGDGELRVQPASPPVAARVHAEPAAEPLGGAVVAVLETLEVPAHLLGAPGPIARDVGNRVPVLVVRVNEDQRVVRSTPPERTGARVEDAIHAGAVPRLAVFRIASLLQIVGVVADEEVPAHRLVLGGEGVERRDVVIVGQCVRSGRMRVAAGERARVAASFEEQDGETLLGQSRRNGAATGARADHDELGVVRRRRTRSGERGFIRTPDRSGTAGRDRARTERLWIGCVRRRCGIQRDTGDEQIGTVHGVTSFSETRSAPACHRR